MDDFVKAMLGRMSRGELTLRRQTPDRETKWMYHVGATDPETGRIVVALGSAGRGDDFSWGLEIRPSQAELYLASDEELGLTEARAM